MLAVGIAAVGVYTANRADAAYTSSGTIFVDNQSLVSAQSGVQSGQYLSYLSPAQFTSQELYGLLQTDVFMEAVLQHAGVSLPTDPTERAAEVAELRNGMSAYASSQNLVKVNVSSPDPDLSYKLADAIIFEFVQFKIGLDVAESGASESFFNELADSYKTNLDDARQAVDDALRGVDNDEELSLQQSLQLERLKEAESLADERYRNAVNAIETSRLAGLQTETDVRQSYSTFDPPQRPAQADGGLFDSLLTIVAFIGAGLLVAMAWPVLTGLTTRTVLFEGEMEHTVPVMGAVPRVRKRLIRLDKVDPDEGRAAGDRDHSGKTAAESLATRTITFMPSKGVAAPPPAQSDNPAQPDTDSQSDTDAQIEPEQTVEESHLATVTADVTSIIHELHDADSGSKAASDDVVAASDWEPAQAIRLHRPPTILPPNLGATDGAKPKRSNRA